MTQDKDTQNQDGQSGGQDANASDKGDKDKQITDQNMIPRSRLNQEIEKRKAAESELKEIAVQLKADVPEDMQDLVPDLPPATLIKWLRNALAKGVFEQKSADSPDSKRPNQQQTQDLSDLSPMQMMSMGYGKK